MSWFSRRRDDEQAPASGVDDDLAPLTRADADWLRAAAAEAFTRAGFVGVVVAPDHVRAADGARYGLANLAAQLALVERPDWAAVVRDHAQALRTAHARPAEERLSDVVDLLVARVLLEADLPEVDPAAGPSLGGGLCVRAAIDYPESVSTLFGSRYGGWAALGDAAMAGLRRLPAPDHQLLEHQVHVLVAPDFFGASRLLLHDEVLDAVDARPRPFGTLVAVPDRSALMVHVLQDATVVHALHLMARIARGRQETPGPLSPHVYYRSPDGTLQQVTRYEGDGVQVHVEGAFADAMSAAGLVG
ncbi:hypothetical protein KIN34_08620 [Cellulomonas sp. DKR-3]|uniref:Uncharacterized protein n=1 Tax=Cellulomonas fulva TaxID=2835530 RepID=A0ABS5TZ17_9CELL|nr:hypothetical protein [Cellulomonas fulva]MBT0994347.1 hypothetical protein [Cellulomonas fulva]